MITFVSATNNLKRDIDGGFTLREFVALAIHGDRDAEVSDDGAAIRVSGDLFTLANDGDMTLRDGDVVSYLTSATSEGGVKGA